MSVFLVRVLNFTILPVLVAFLLIRRESKDLSRLDRLEIYLIYLFGLGVAGSGIGGFFGHIFMSDVVAQSIGWPTGSPFQLEIGFANLALGVLGILATSKTGGFRTATVIAVTVFGVGASLVHFYDILLTGNLAPGNTIQNIANLAKPALLIVFLRGKQRVMADSAGATPGDQWLAWQNWHAQGAGIVTAIVASGFGLGFAFGAPVLGSLLAILLGVGILMLRRSATVQ